MEQNKKIPEAGEIYYHFKHPEQRYRIIGIGKHTETLEDVVVYEALYESAFSKLVVRPLKMFLEDVERDGKIFPRFTRVEN